MLPHLLTALFQQSTSLLLLISQRSQHLCCSFMKVGCMVFLVHDINDIFMEAAKLARYAGHQTLCTVLFVTFMLSWFASRIYYLPVYIIRSTLTEPITVSISMTVFFGFVTVPLLVVLTAAVMTRSYDCACCIDCSCDGTVLGYAADAACVDHAVGGRCVQR
jgi:hypothetical protein